MRLRFFRTLTQRQYVRELEDRYGSPEQLEARVRREPALRPLLEEWKHFAARTEHADEPITVETALVSKDPALVLRALTPERVRLFEYLRDHPGVESLRQLAQGLRRNYRNVYEDATALAKTGILELERHPNRVVPRVRAESIQIEV